MIINYLLYDNKDTRKRANKCKQLCKVKERKEKIKQISLVRETKVYNTKSKIIVEYVGQNGETIREAITYGKIVMSL